VGAFRLSRLAEADLLSIGVYTLRTWGEAQIVRYIGELEDCCQQLAEDGGPTTAGLPPGAGNQSASTSSGPSIFTAVREQLGLRLESGRGLVEVIVIDDVHMPTAN
jgi:plasmid stabilization system protein ParE